LGPVRVSTRTGHPDEEETMGKKTGKKTVKIKDLGAKDAKTVRGGAGIPFGKVQLEYKPQTS
jgi:hypothetical protein